jgi:hypothetical protein
MLMWTAGSLLFVLIWLSACKGPKKSHPLYSKPVTVSDGSLLCESVAGWIGPNDHVKKLRAEPTGSAPSSVTLTYGGAPIDLSPPAGKYLDLMIVYGNGVNINDTIYVTTDSKGASIETRKAGKEFKRRFLDFSTDRYHSDSKGVITSVVAAEVSTCPTGAPTNCIINPPNGAYSVITLMFP